MRRVASIFQSVILSERRESKNLPVLLENLEYRLCNRARL